jgi:hypothetical protein
VEVFKELEGGFRKPHGLRKVLSFDVADVAAKSRSSNQNLVVAMVEWYNIRTKERVVQR